MFKKKELKEIDFCVGEITEYYKILWFKFGVKKYFISMPPETANCRCSNF